MVRTMETAMRSSIDAAGRLVIPKSIREAAGLRPDTPLEIRFRDGRVEIAPAPVEEYAKRIDALLGVIDGDRLGVSASCGCGRMPHDDAITLIRNLVKAARLAG